MFDLRRQKSGYSEHLDFLGVTLDGGRYPREGNPALGIYDATDGKLDRNWLKGALGDAMHAVLCGAGHNIRMILRKLRLLCVFILAVLLNRLIAADVVA